MAEIWTAQYGPSSVQDDDAGITVNVNFLENGVLKHTRAFTGVADQEQINRAIQNQLNQYNKVGNFDLTALVGDYVPIVVQPPPIPTPEQIAKDKYFKDYRALQHTHTLVGMGAMESNDPYYTGLQTIVGAGFRPEYIP